LSDAASEGGNYPTWLSCLHADCSDKIFPGLGRQRKKKVYMYICMSIYIYMHMWLLPASEGDIYYVYLLCLHDDCSANNFPGLNR
jgi:hypothetical protein